MARHTDRRADDLARLDDASLARVVPHLAPEALHQLVQARGLDACGAIVAAATPAQVASLLDLDLWRAPAPGRDDALDAARFAMWLEILMDEGSSIAARVVAEMDPTLATLGLSRHIRVFDPGALLSPLFGTDDEGAFDTGRHGGDEAAIGGYVIRARGDTAWDAITGLLTALADEHPDAFRALMRGCRGLSDSRPEIDGLDDLLSKADQAVHDAAAARESRRTARGYLSAANARAFLELARRRRPASATTTPVNAIADAYLNAMPADDAPDAAPPSSIDARLDASDGVRADADGPPARPKALPGAAAGDDPPATAIHRLMAALFDADPAAYLARNRELAFLANALVVGCSIYGRPFTVPEAWDVAAGVCSLGLESAPDRDLVSAFEAGWTQLFEDVSLVVARALIAVLRDLHSADPVVERDLHALHGALVRHRNAGTPWLAHDSLEVLAILDTPTWACLLGLLSECPVLPAAMTAILDGDTTPVTATAFACFATIDQIRRVRAFTDRLGDLLR